MSTKSEASGRLSRYLMVIGAALAVGLVVAACGSSSSSSSSSTGSSAGATGESGESSSGEAEANTEPIKVAAIVSETGPAPFANWSTGADAYFDHLNAEGGINGHKVEFTRYDDKGEPTQASQLAHRLVGEGVVAFVASLSLSDCAVNRKYYEQENIISIDIGSDPTCFNSANIAPVNSGPMVDPLLQMLYAAEELHKKKVCAMGFNVPGEAADVKEAIKYYEQISGQKLTLSVQGFELNADPTPAVIKFVNAGCEAVSVSADIDTGPPFMKAVGTQHANNIDWMMGLATYSPEFAEAVGQDGNGLLMGLEYRSFEAPESAQMLEEFKEAGLPAAMPTVTGWTAAYAFAHGIEGIEGEITREKVTEAFKNLKPFSVPSMGTPFSFGPGKTHNPNQASFFVKLENEKFSDVSEDFFVLPEGVIPR